MPMQIMRLVFVGVRDFFVRIGATFSNQKSVATATCESHPQPFLSSRVRDPYRAQWVQHVRFFMQARGGRDSGRKADEGFGKRVKQAK